MQTQNVLFAPKHTMIAVNRPLLSTKALRIATVLPFVAFCAATLFFQSVLCTAVTAATSLSLAALNYLRLRNRRLLHARGSRCPEALALLQKLRDEEGLRVPRGALISHHDEVAYDSSVDFLIVTEQWLRTLKSDPAAATAVVVHEIAHRQEVSPAARYITTLTRGTWPVLLVTASIYEVTVALAATPTWARASHLVLTLAAATMAYGLGFLASSAASRELELRADASAALLGLGPALVREFRRRGSPGHPKSLIYQFIYTNTSTHPSVEKRVCALSTAPPTSGASATASTI